MGWILRRKINITRRNNNWNLRKGKEGKCNLRWKLVNWVGENFRILKYVIHIQKVDHTLWLRFSKLNYMHKFRISYDVLTLMDSFDSCMLKLLSIQQSLTLLFFTFWMDFDFLVKQFLKAWDGLASGRDIGEYDSGCTLAVIE